MLPIPVSTCRRSGCPRAREIRTQRTLGNPDDGYIVEQAAFNGSWTWREDRDIGASRIAVDINGRPWVVAVNGLVFRRKSDNINARNDWLQMGTMPAWDIALGSDTMLHQDGTAERVGRAWIVSQENVVGGRRVYVRNDQPSFVEGSGTSPRQTGWMSVMGTGAEAIAAGPSGIWIVDGSLNLWKQR